MKRELIYTDKGKQTDFQKQVNFVMFKSNDLIRIFNENQPFVKIKTRSEAESLILGSIEYYDSIVLQSIKLPKNNLEVNVLKLCELYSIPRGEFCRLIGLSPDHVSGCATCNTSKTIKLKGENIISFDQYNSYSEFLIWGNGFFDLNNSAIEKHKETFSIYADTPSRIEVVNFWQSLCTILNQYHDKYHISNEDKRLIGKALKLQQSEGFEGTFVINNQALSLEIQITK